MAKASRVLLVTAASLVGDYLHKVFSERGFTVVAAHQRAGAGEAGIDPLAIDLRDEDSLKRAFEYAQPDIVLLSAALTNVDLCETDQDLAYRINVAGPAALARLCADKVKLVFFSSDYVFDGTAGPYAEDDKPSPVDYYGRAKLEAEQCIRTLVRDYLIVRTTVVYGNEAAGKNFALSLVKMLSAGQSRKVPVDQVGNPTHALNLSRIVEELVRAGGQGVYNVVGADLIARYDFALEICSVFGLNKQLVIPVTTAELKQAAPRPLKAGLRTEKVRAAVATKPLGVKAGLALLKDELKWNV